MKLFLKIEAWTTDVALKLSMLFLLLATAMAVYQVTTRFFFGHPSVWSEVIARSAMIWGVFLGVAPAVREGSMIAAEVVQRSLPPRIGLGLHLISTLLTFIFFAILFWQGWAMTQRVVRQKISGLEISMSWAYASLPVGCAFILIAVLASGIRAAQGEWAERAEVIQ